MEWRSIATQGGTALKPIAIVSLHASPVAALGAGENGGMNVYVRAVCEELSRRGIGTEVFTRRASVDGPERVRLAEKSWVTRLRVGPAEDLDKGGLFDLLPSFTEAVLGEQRRRRTGYGLVHSHYWLSGWVGARLRDEWKVPWFHTFQAIVRNSDRLIASSLQEADDLVRLYGASRSRVSVVAPGVDLRLFAPRPTEALRIELGLGDAPVVVFAGRLERLKGAEIVIRAVALLTAADKESERPVLIVIGADSHDGASESRASGGERARLEALARELGISGHVRFVGSVDQAALASYLSLAAVCVVPSYSESFGLVALEASACGTPVVAARVGGVPTIVKDGLTGFTLVSHDPAQYAERIGRLLSDEELRLCFSRRSRLVATQFSWTDTVDRLVAEYRSPRLPELQPAVAG